MGTDITDDQTYLDLVARYLNNRPRRTLDYRTPAEVFTDLMASGNCFAQLITPSDFGRARAVACEYWSLIACSVNSEATRLLPVRSLVSY